MSVACLFPSTNELHKLWLLMGSNGQKRIAKKKANETIKRELLLNSLQENEDVEEK